ncbi:hypothetical protein PITCH_A350038 [uncultured Desulfobacterium sp.]|uniref:Uncharacterized protein n=1 Tax=uncultured Desulfobacterium sp. TaxID=201089 RepID=A0A445MZG3_9BACT|nr:hypothetical protein PITCH_A350038 [uncultured Desulfobacterium sp.]
MITKFPIRMEQIPTDAINPALFRDGYSAKHNAKNTIIANAQDKKTAVFTNSKEA